MPDVDAPSRTPAGPPATGEPPGSGRGRGTSGRERLLTALLHPGRGQVVVAVLLAMLGFAAVLQVRTADVDDRYTGLRERDLVDVLSGLAGTSQRARAEIARLEQTKRELQSDSQQLGTALEEAQKQVDTLNILAGLVPVTGPGVRITITEETGPVDIDSVLDTIEELRSAGAEAMQFNGEVRVVAQTALEDSVGGFSVDGTLLTSPYVIDVIGDPQALRGALVFRDGPVSQLHDDGAEVEIDELERIDIESVVEAERPQFAQPE